MVGRTKRRAEPHRPGVDPVPIKIASNHSFAVPPLRAPVAPVEVDDPYGNPGDKIVVLRQFRNDQLASLHAHRHITDQQYEAGRLWQRDVEVANRGLCGIDTTRERVDGGLPADPLSDAQQRARKRINGAVTAMGLDGAALARDVLIEGLTYSQVALMRAGMYHYCGGDWHVRDHPGQMAAPIFGTKINTRGNGGPASHWGPTEVARSVLGRAHILKLGVILHSALDCLAIHYGLTTPNWN